MEYLDERRLKDLVKKHSNFISYPVSLLTEKVVSDDGKKNEGKVKDVKEKEIKIFSHCWDIVNKQKPICVRVRKPEDVTSGSSLLETDDDPTVEDVDLEDGNRNEKKLKEANRRDIYLDAGDPEMPKSNADAQDGNCNVDNCNKKLKEAKERTKDGNCYVDNCEKQLKEAKERTKVCISSEKLDCNLKMKFELVYCWPAAGI